MATYQKNKPRKTTKIKVENNSGQIPNGPAFNTRGFNYDPSKPIEPLDLIRQLWPMYRLSREQKMMVRSAWEDDETIVPSGNKVGKDFITGLIALIFFLTRSPCRIVITSVNDKHLAVIWGEIRRHIDLCKVPLDFKKGGCLRINSEKIRRVRADNSECPSSYIVNMVCADDTIESLMGHHATPTTIEEARLNVPLTMAITDESSAISDDKITKLKTWCKRLIMIGNTWPCESYFRYAVDGDPRNANDKGGDIPRASGRGFHRKVIPIRAEDSPNVRYAFAQLKAGVQETDEKFAPIMVPGMRDYWEYKFKRATLDKLRQAAELDAVFYKGSELLLFPPEWLAYSARIAQNRRGEVRVATSIGVDSAEGGDDFAMIACDLKGVLDIECFKTPDTNVIPRRVIAFGKKHNVSPANWIFDRGGGGKQHCDRLRAKGYPVRTIAFNDVPSILPPREGEKSIKDRVEQFEDKAVYKNRRAEMYGELSLAMNPQQEVPGFAIPATEEWKELRRQLALMPKLYDGEGVLYMLSKNKKKPNSNEKTLNEILGCSPDESDALVLSYWGARNQVRMGSASATVTHGYSNYVPR